MRILITLLLATVVSPTLLDRSDLSNNCESVLAKRAISQESVNNGFAQGTVYADFTSAIGLTDNRVASYAPCNEFGERFFTSEWAVSASLSSNEGLSVIENGAVVFRQGRPYAADRAVVRIQHQGNELRYYLNGRLVFSSVRPDVSARDLRAYYFGTVESPLISTVRIPASKLARRFSAAYSERVAP